MMNDSIRFGGALGSRQFALIYERHGRLIHLLTINVDGMYGWNGSRQFYRYLHIATSICGGVNWTDVGDAGYKIALRTNTEENGG
jgi:hypothetical protein